MSPMRFSEQTCTLAENQPEYLPLPVFQDDTVTVSKWKFTLWERMLVLFGYPLWICQMNFGTPLQPQLPGLIYPFEKKPQ